MSVARRGGTTARGRRDAARRSKGQRDDGVGRRRVARCGGGIYNLKVISYFCGRDGICGCDCICKRDCSEIYHVTTMRRISTLFVLLTGLMAVGCGSADNYSVVILGDTHYDALDPEVYHAGYSEADPERDRPDSSQSRSFG